jgi:hypothetical protein
MKTIHMSLSVRGALKWPAKLQRQLCRGMTHDDGRKFSRDDFRDWLLDALAHGFELLPMGPPCEGFDPKSGCPGHEETQ